MIFATDKIYQIKSQTKSIKIFNVAVFSRFSVENGSILTFVIQTV